MLILYVKILRPIKYQKQAWAFYAVRDGLIALVRDGYLERESIIFLHFYPAVNNLIKYIHPLKFRELVRSLAEINKQTEGRAKQLVQAVEQSSPEVKKVVFDLFRSIDAALIDNSPFLKILFLLYEFKPLKEIEPKHVIPYRQDLQKALSETRNLEEMFDKGKLRPALV
jgi:hypothetical protein